MSILFADIYDGIRAIRVSKGVCERDILNYVQEKAGGCMKVGNVLKTIRTLKKLVDDGELIKKGNRYCFPPKDECSKEEEEEEEDEEEEAPDDEGGEELDMDPDECDEGDDDEEEEEEDDEEEEEEEDDEEEEEEDDDEDEDEEEEDESCDDNEAKATGQGDTQTPESNGQSPDKSPAPPNQGEPDCAGAQKPIDEVSYSRNGIARNIDSNTKNNVRKTVKDKNILDQNNGPERGGETIAFCARDFIDSLAESKSERSSEEKIEISKGTDRVIKTQKRFSSASKKSQPPLKRSYMERFRSRSPLQGRKRDFSRVGQELSNNLGFTGVEKEILGESMNSKMEIDVKAEPEAFGVPQKSPARTSPMPDVQMDLQDEKDGRNPLMESGTVNRSGSSDGLVENIPEGTLKLMQLKPANYSNMVWYPLEDSDNTQDGVKECSSLGNSDVVARKDSMCSICEKKKRTS